MASSAATNAENSVKKIYLTVIEEVLQNVREAFLDEGYDEQLLQELRQLWENKLNASRAVQQQDETTNGSNGNTGSNATATPVASKETTNKSSLNNQNNAPVNNSTPINTDIKNEIDPATRIALYALSQTHPNPNIHHHISNNNNNNNNRATNGTKKALHTPQLDGGVDGSSSDDEDDDDEIGAVSIHGDDEDDDKTNNEDHSECEGKEDPEPLNSDDDLTDQGSPDSQSDLFDTDHVIVCQYDKITRIKNRWKFHLKDGIMNINGKDYLFSKANGDAEW